LDLLGPELEELKGLDFDLALTGFDQREIEALLLAPNDAEDDAPPLPDNPVSKPGDLWLLGPHKLLCGDATNAEDVARLMNREKARLFACDPPYLINYKGGNHPQSWANSPDTKDKHWDDYQDPAKAVEFYVDYLRIGLAHCIERVPVYQWHGDLRRVIVAEAWERAGLLLHQIIVWVKARPVLTRSHFMWQHEVCAYGWRTGKVPSKPPANSHSVWTIDQIGESDGIHPTQKPVELARRPILYQTQPGDICYEPFSGSGTTIAAAELTGRRCYAMEISPAFVDVAVLRWQALTNQTARLDGAGKTFDEIRAERLAVAA
jgi:DNA modification methylase